MGGELLKYVVDAAVALGAGAAVFALWVANRKPIAAETLGRAEEQASRVLRDAEREGDTRRKEALLDAKERAHELRLEAEQYVRDHRQQIAEACARPGTVVGTVRPGVGGGFDSQPLPRPEDGVLCPRRRHVFGEPHLDGRVRCVGPSASQQHHRHQVRI